MGNDNNIFAYGKLKEKLKLIENEALNNESKYTDQIDLCNSYVNVPWLLIEYQAAGYTKLAELYYQLGCYLFDYSSDSFELRKAEQCFTYALQCCDRVENILMVIENPSIELQQLLAENNTQGISDPALAKAYIEQELFKKINSQSGLNFC